MIAQGIKWHVYSNTEKRFLKKIVIVDCVMYRFKVYIFILNHCRMWLFGFIHLPYNVVVMQILFKNPIAPWKILLENCRIWQFICNDLILYMHLISENCRMWLFNFLRTLKIVITVIGNRNIFLKEFVYAWLEYHNSIVYWFDFFICLRI